METTTTQCPKGTITAICPKGTLDHSNLGFASLLSNSGFVEVGQIAAITTNGTSLIIPVHQSRSHSHETAQLDILLVDRDIFIEGINAIIISKELIHSEQKEFSYHPASYRYTIKFTDLTPHQRRLLHTITSH